MPEQYVGKWESSKAEPQCELDFGIVRVAWVNGCDCVSPLTGVMGIVGVFEDERRGLGAWDDDYEDVTDILPNVGGGPMGPARAGQEPIGRSEPREAVERVFEVVVERGE
ncbi:hypothetical protein GYMLUDRAFT_265970 [Collybiopsis luxurians FD-317 M1]|jgi:hypothetical protein|uniref:Uncharacterized protein n=1 Tax=Collybiopsis luxurians FD-317 M1 TaxID=944289 RepID=A0A0D0BA02_9AGAR|nr:hypothetical protein GYMLUDRAFT_265970 [Collybiopsis luxurians FD-317 M1]